MKFISWNVNGIRSVMKKGFMDFVQKTPFDVLCLQEVRALQEQSGLDIPSTHTFWNAAEKKGYAGTAIITRHKPKSVSYGIGKPELDKEGRVITAEFEDFFLVTVYTVNSQRELTRLKYRELEWDAQFLKLIKKLEKMKPVIFCGDLNVAHKEIDLARPKENTKNAGFTMEERKGFDNYIKAGFIDTFREFNQEGGHYTWWSQMGGARARNVGWRIDYFCVSSALRSRLKEATIMPHIMGSDHCPVTMTLS